MDVPKNRQSPCDSQVKPSCFLESQLTTWSGKVSQTKTVCVFVRGIYLPEEGKNLAAFSSLRSGILARRRKSRLRDWQHSHMCSLGGERAGSETGSTHTCVILDVPLLLLVPHVESEVPHRREKNGLLPT